MESHGRFEEEENFSIPAFDEDHSQATTAAAEGSAAVSLSLSVSSFGCKLTAASPSAPQQPLQERFVDRASHNCTTTTTSNSNSNSSNDNYYPVPSASTAPSPFASGMNQIRNTVDQDPSESSTLEGSGYSYSMSLSDKGGNSVGTKSNAMSSIGVSSLSNGNTTSSSLSDVMYTHARRRALHDEEYNTNYKNDKDMDDYSMSGKHFMERKLRRQRSEGRRRRMQSCEEEEEQLDLRVSKTRPLPVTGFASYPEETKATLKDSDEEKDHDDDDTNSIVSLSAKNLLERKQRKQMAIAKLREKSQRNSLLLHHPEMTITVVPETKATSNPKPPPPPEQSKKPRRQSFTDGSIKSLGMSTIATRDLDDDDSELVLSPIQEKTAACWRRHQPNVRPERKASMGMASVLEDETPATPPTRMKISSCSVVSEDYDDDDEESLSPLQVNLPKEQVQAALEKLHRSQPFHQALAPPLTQGNSEEVPRRSVFEAPSISQDVKSSRRGMFEKAKSVSHLEQKLMALPSNMNDHDQYDFLKFHPTKPNPNDDKNKNKNNDNDNPHLPHVTLPLTPQKPTTPKTSSFQGQRSIEGQPERRGSRKPGECRSLSPVKNRWITGCQDGAKANNNTNMNPSESPTMETVPPANDKGGWHLAVPSDHNHPHGPNQTLMLFRRSGSAPTPPPPPKHQDALVGLGTAPKSSRTKAENATLPPRRPSLSKSMSTPNLFNESKNTQDLVVSTIGVVEPLPADKIDSIVSFLLGEGLPPPKEEDDDDDEETLEEVTPPAGKAGILMAEREQQDNEVEKEAVEQEGEMSEDESDNEAEDNIAKNEPGSNEDAFKTTNESLIDKDFTSKPFSLEELFSEPSGSKPDASVSIAQSLPTGATHSNLPSHGSIMQDFISSKTNAKRRQSASPGLMKKLKNQVKAGTRYLRKKSYSVGEQDDMTRFSQSMSAFDSSFGGTMWRMEKLQEDFGDEDDDGGGDDGDGGEVHSTDTQDDRKTNETLSIATIATSTEKYPPDDIVKIGKAIGAKLKKFPFMRSSSVPVLFVNDDDAPENETEPTSAHLRKKTSLDVSLRGGANTLGDKPKTAPISPVPSKGTPRRKPRNSLATRPPSLRNLGTSPQVSPRQSLSPRLPVKDQRILQTKERPSLKNLDEADQSSHTRSKSQRNIKSEKRRSSRRSCTSDKRSRSSTRKEKHQRSKSASSKQNKEKQSRQSNRKKPSNSPSPRSKAKEDASLRSYITEKDALNTCPHLTGPSSSEMKSFGRQMSNRTLDNSRRSSLSGKSSGRERRNSRMQKAQSSRDVYQRRGKARTMDETSMASARAASRSSKKTKSKDRFMGSSVSSIDDVDASYNSAATTRSSKMKGAAKARSERLLGSSASSFEDDIDRSKSKAKRPSDSRRRTGSYSSLLSPPPPMRKSVSARLVVDNVGLIDDEESGMQKRRSVASQAAAFKSASCRQLIGETASTDEEEGSRQEKKRRSITSRLSRPQETHRRIKKSQSLRHVDGK